MRIARLLLIIVVAIVGAVLQAAPAREIAHATVLGQNGKIAFFGSLEGLVQGIVVIDPNGVDEPDQVTIGDDRYPDWSPDGARIAFSRSTEPGIQIVNADGTDPVTLAGDDPEDGWYPRWSPDGTRIAYYDSSAFSIVTINADGSDRVDLGVINGLGYSTWSPGGSELAFTDSDDVNGGGLYGMAADGTGHRRLIAEGVGGWPDWSPDGKVILATGGVPAGPLVQEHIFAVDAFGDSSPDDLGMGTQPRWSPDGKRIVFTRMSLNLTDPPGQFYVADGISMMNADGSGRVDLTPGDTDLQHIQMNPSWQPLPAAIDSVEFTQAIQEWQTLGALQEDLADDGQPPVAMVADKPAVMRVYFSEVDEPASYTVEVSGQISGFEDVTLDAGCTPTDRRRQAAGCTSVDFYFTPPEGDWSVRLVVKDFGNMPVFDDEFALTSVKTKPLTLVPVQACDSLDAGNWQCSLPSDIGPLMPFLRNTFPGQVNVVYRGDTVRRSPTDDDKWWSALLADANSYWAAAGSMRYEYYYAIVRWNAGGDDSPGGMAYTPGHAGGSRNGAIRSDLHGGNRSTADEILAHELGHNFGRQHAPSPASAGCYNQPSDLDAGWPYPNDPTIQQVGFDVATGKAKVETEYTDWVSYCTPRWITPYTYNAVADVFEAPSAPALRVASAPVAGPFWFVTGTIQGDALEVSPLFQVDAVGPVDEGAGDYRIEVRGAGDAVLFTRRFEPSHAHTEFEDLGEAFLESVPVQAGASSLVILGPGDVELKSIALDGAIPSVDITLPGAFAGNQTVEWAITDADGGTHTSWVQYSTDGGATWRSLAMGVSETSLVVDFDTIAGSADARIRVLVSDGANTGSATSAPFSVGNKEPTAQITAPDGGTFRVGQLVWLQGLAFDLDDGFLDDGAVTWSSNKDGSLGDGASLPVYDLSVGTHTITMTARDSDNNVVTDSIAVTIFDGPIVEGEPDVLSGDVDCSGAVNSVDALKLSRQVAGLPVAQTEPCPDIGTGDASIFGDVNCNGNITAVDTLFVLRFVAGMPVNLPQECRQIGT